MPISHNYNLVKYNTFAVEYQCAQFVTIQSLSDLEMLPQSLKIGEVLILGSGSNILLTKDIDKTVIHIEPKQYITQVDGLTIVWAGTPWNNLVNWSVEKKLGGIENLALIPGLAGAAPIQNIGAYGAEISDVLVWVEAYNWQTGMYHRFSHAECQFNYRSSIFKHSDQPHIITRIALDLKPDRPINLSYEPLKNHFADYSKPPTYQEIALAVSKIRRAKLPDPKILANAGSFFKNPILKKEDATRLKNKYPHMPIYDLADEKHVKISAAWLLEKCGYKGLRNGDAGFAKSHALILVNYGQATGKQLHQLSLKAKRAVEKKFSILLEEEVRIVQ